MFLGLEHTAIASANPEKLAHWYCEHLGFHINFRYDAFFFVKAPNGSMLEIIPSKGDRFDEQALTPGIRHLAIAVEDFDQAHALLKSMGVEFTAEPYTNQGNRLVFFKDLEGNLLHLIHRAQPLP